MSLMESAEQIFEELDVLGTGVKDRLVHTLFPTPTTYALVGVVNVFWFVPPCNMSCVCPESRQVADKVSLKT